MAENKSIKSITSTKSIKGTKNVKVDVVDTKGKVVEALSLPSEIFGVKENPTLVAQAVRVYLANQRQGTLSTKSRGDINATTKKVWRQKGTGRARHGAKSAPIFVGGGVAFGPKPRDFSLKFPQKMKQKALFSVLTSKVKENSLKVVSGMGETSKTKEAFKVLQNLSLTPSKNRVLFVTDGKSPSVYKAIRNIEGVEVVSSSLLNTYVALKGSTILFTKEAIDAFVAQQKKN
jgi:large subunit ribosomal protein L4